MSNEKCEHVRDTFAFDRHGFAIALVRAGFKNPAALGRHLGIPKSSMHNIAFGKAIKLEVRQRLASALGVEPEMLWVPVSIEAQIL